MSKALADTQSFIGGVEFVEIPKGENPTDDEDEDESGVAELGLPLQGA